ncbi:MAG: hypothetical protein K8R36_22185, partial [Planctomycetales bacterium]|nr:hypothetical protein [Planctomycetales bacterium]
IAVLIGTVGKRAYDRWRNIIALESRERAIRELEGVGVRTSKKYYRDENRYGEIARLQFPTQVCKPRHFQLAAEIGDLDWLDLDYTNFRDSDAPTLAAHPNLKRLALAGNLGAADETLKSVAKLQSLEFLELGGTGVTDEGLPEIARLPKLQHLGLSRTAVTSPGLVHLRPLQSLRFLGLSLTNVDDTGLEAIAELRGLETICLSNTKVRGTSLAALARLTKLTDLRLQGCSLQDGSGLAQLKSLKHLLLTDCQIPPGFLKNVWEMNKLESLNLRGSAITDDHLAELYLATQLSTLLLGKTDTLGGTNYRQNLSEEALRRLRAELPYVRIVVTP